MQRGSGICEVKIKVAGKTRTINGKTCVSTAFLAEIFGVTNKTLSEWEKKGCPKIQRGYWCPADVLKWRDSTAHETKEDPDTLPPAQRKLYWDAECKKAQTEAQQFKNAVLRGDYLDKEETKQELYRFFTMLKQTILAQPRRTAIFCAQYIGSEHARQLENELTAEVTNVLEQWSKGKLDTGMDCGVHESPKTTGKNDRKRVGRQKQDTGPEKQ